MSLWSTKIKQILKKLRLCLKLISQPHRIRLHLWMSGEEEILKFPWKEWTFVTLVYSEFPVQLILCMMATKKEKIKKWNKAIYVPGLKFRHVKIYVRLAQKKEISHFYEQRFISFKASILLPFRWLHKGQKRIYILCLESYSLCPHAAKRAIEKQEQTVVSHTTFL